ncbi:MAG: molybdopterin molybdotransferase MoeA [Planctomycetes bacterium]|nr:molybdopterin molybdotransferase MoeA [Planctomycetota bacterium]
MSTKQAFGTLVSAEDALDSILSRVKPVLDTEEVGLADADGRVVAEDIKSTINVPAFDRAGMDGYAVMAEDLAEPAMLRTIGVALAGKPFTKGIKRGECVQIATGAPIPKGANAVVMQENAQVVGGAVSFRIPVRKGEHIATKASDIGKGQVVLKRGTVMGPGQVAALAIIGKPKVKVYSRPQVLIFTTGDEVAAPGKPLKAGQVYDCNSFALVSTARRAGADADYRPNVKDTVADLLKVVKDAAGKYHAIVFSGGTSVGARDFAEEVVGELGQVHVHGVAIKPGKPVLFGTVGKCAIFGLPGYPTSCLLTAKLFLAPALRRMAHITGIDRPHKTVTLGHEVKQDKTKQILLPVKVDDHDVAWSTFKDSGSITSLSESIGYIEIDAGDGVVQKGAEAVVRIIR